MLTRIEAYNYRCFADLAVDLGDFHVLAGANGSGKSTLLDIPVVLGDLLSSRQISEAFLTEVDGRPPRAQSFTELVHCGQGSRFGFAIEARLPDVVLAVMAEESRNPRFRLPTHLRYELHLEVPSQKLGPRVLQEFLIHFHEDDPVRPIPAEVAVGDPNEVTRDSRGRAQSFNWVESWRPVIARTSGAAVRYTPETSDETGQLLLQSPGNRLALSNVPFDETQFPAALWFSRLLGQQTVSYRPDWSLLRRPAPPGDPLELRSDARNTPWLALALQREDPEWYSAWVDHVRTVLPHLRDIDVIEREEDYFAYFRVTYQGGHMVTSSGLSDGTLRAMALTLPAYLTHTPILLITEEPENGIHPQGIESVMDALRSVQGSQVLVATQSPLVVLEAGLRQVLAVRVGQDGASTIVRGDQHPNMATWRGGLDIGSLFAAGVFE